MFSKFFRPITIKSVKDFVCILFFKTNSLIDYIKSNIRINAINPGTINTPMVRNSITGDVEESLELFGKDIPIGRVGDPKEIGQVASFLASNGASFISGEYINVDGGIMAKGGWDADLKRE